MDRGWYLRLGVVLCAAAFAWLALWPSFDEWKLIPAPDLVKETFKGRISPGLDIQGGLRLMYEVEVDEAIRDRRDRIAQQLRPRLGVLLGLLDESSSTSATPQQLSKLDERFKVQLIDERNIRVTFNQANDTAKVTNEYIAKNFPELKRVSRGGTELELTMNPDSLDRLRTTAVEQAVKTVSSRINELEVRDMSIQGREDDLIIEIPGASEAMFDRIRTIIAKTARLEFKIVDDEAQFIAGLSDLPEGVEKVAEQAQVGEGKVSSTAYLTASGENSRQKLMAYVKSLPVPDDHQVLVGPNESSEKAEGGQKPEESWRTYYLWNATDVTGEDVENAYVGFDNDKGQGQPVVQIEFNGRGADAFGRLTGANVKRRMAIVLDDVVESAPNIQERIGGGHCRITLGSFRDYNSLLREANDLVVVLKAGALPAPIRPANEQLIGPTLGRDAVQQGAKGAAIGILFVLVFMLIYYQVGGGVADLMVILNVMLLLATLAFLEATLTLPGIAGIALTVGMAVDANVLINERIREELRLGKSPRAAVEQGFGRAFWSIFDSQITTFIAGVVLFQYGTGAIKGFAVTLMIGIITSLFTGVFCSKVFMDWIVRGWRVNRLPIG
ncbi:MAG: protein translocase subunit SecD [Polyangiales bacterium]